MQIKPEMRQFISFLIKIVDNVLKELLIEIVLLKAWIALLSNLLRNILNHDIEQSGLPSGCPCKFLRFYPNLQCFEDHVAHHKTVLLVIDTQFVQWDLGTMRLHFPHKYVKSVPFPILHMLKQVIKLFELLWLLTVFQLALHCRLHHCDLVLHCGVASLRQHDRDLPRQANHHFITIFTVLGDYIPRLKLPVLETLDELAQIDFFEAFLIKEGYVRNDFLIWLALRQDSLGFRFLNKLSQFFQLCNLKVRFSNRWL